MIHVVWESRPCKWQNVWIFRHLICEKVNWNWKLTTKWQTTADLDMRTATGKYSNLSQAQSFPPCLCFDTELCFPQGVCPETVWISSRQLWRTTRFWSLQFLLSSRGGEFHPEVSLSQPLLSQVDREAVQPRAGGPGRHPRIYLDLLPPVRAQCYQSARAQAAEVNTKTIHYQGLHVSKLLKVLLRLFILAKTCLYFGNFYSWCILD